LAMGAVEVLEKVQKMLMTFVWDVSRSGFIVRWSPSLLNAEYVLLSIELV
jgi:hypothetical protein